MTDILPVLIIGIAFDLWPVVTLRVLVNASSYFDCLLTESGHCLVASYLIVTPAYIMEKKKKPPVYTSAEETALQNISKAFLMGKAFASLKIQKA